MSLSFRPIVVLLCAVGLMAGCATSPPIELPIARQAIDSARNEGAQSYAPTELNQAISALEQAERLLDNGQQDQAVLSLQNATQLAISAKSSARTQRETQRQYQQQCEALTAQPRLDTLKAQLEHPQEKLVVQAPAPPQPAETTVATTTNNVSAKTVLVSEYRVGTGENLYAIAARPMIYGEGLLWPLIYRANRDQIKDPQQIFPGQTLSIPRNHSAEELESARETARQSGIFLP